MALLTSPEPSEHESLSSSPEPRSANSRDLGIATQDSGLDVCKPEPGIPSPGSPERDGAILVRGAKMHNLKGIDCEIPLNHLTVVTGVSGSGKSSLAFDTLYAEGQRRYVESLSAYARQFLERMEKPEVDEISGIAPAVAIRQKNSTRNPRSTVGTATEVYDYLRLLFARVGITYCPNCGEEIRRDHVDAIANEVMGMPPGVRFQVMFPLLPQSARLSGAPPDPAEGDGDARNAPAGAELLPQVPAAVKDRRPARRRVTVKPQGARASEAAPTVAESASMHHLPDPQTRQRLFSLRQSGFNRLFQDGRVFEFSTPESLLELDFSKPVDVLVDRLAVAPDVRQRLVDSVELAFREAREVVLEFSALEDGKGPKRLTFSERFECKRCGRQFQHPEPRLFSFNNPFGACPRCQGFGNTIDVDMDRVVPDKNKSLADGAIDPWTKPRYRDHFNGMKRRARAKGIRLDMPYFKLTAAQRQWLVDGDQEFIGIRRFFDLLEHKKYKLHVRVFLSRYRGYTLCPECEGSRLRREALHIRMGGKNIAEVCRMSIREAREFLHQLQFSPAEMTVAEKVLEEIGSRLRFLDEAGLEYLTLERLASTLSGGESQRIQLATSLGSNLVGALYVLDEPSIGLHPRDTGRLITILKRLRDLGNTILVVEHDPAMMRQADKILDLGPGAGEHGGRVVYAGDWDGLRSDPNSLTGRYLSGALEIPVPHSHRNPRGWLKIRGARQHNLKSIDVEIPLGTMTCISGVSGSGKSTLVHDVLYNAMLARMGVPAPRAQCEGVEGGHELANVILVDQSPLGRTPRSNPVTYVKAFDEIRALFASTPGAKKRGFTPGYFSFNVPGGRCETCQGDGTVTVEMQFLADVSLVCEECRGQRFKPSVLEVQYRGKNIAEVLQLTVREALAFFSATPRVTNRLRILDEVGLGYLRLGQSATTLSGGEAQRVRLAAHLAERVRGDALFIFDEPTTGLHFDDINKLLATFRKLIDSGATVLIIEHNLDVLKSADWIIDLGPEGGEAGGYVVAAGPPEVIAQNGISHTGKFLAPLLARQ
jgi:excinuclease ABC subunit A